MIIDQSLLREALELTTRDRRTPRTAGDMDHLMDRYIAEFVAESESIEGHDCTASEVLASAHALPPT